MVNYIATGLLSIIIVAKLIALIHYLKGNYSSKVMNLWIPIGDTDDLKRLSKEKQGKLKRIICFSMILDIVLAVVAIIIFPKVDTTIILLLSLVFYLNGFFLEKYTQKMTALKGV